VLELGAGAGGVGLTEYVSESCCCQCVGNSLKGIYYIYSFIYHSINAYSF
jgi:hypothetical protein